MKSLISRPAIAAFTRQVRTALAGQQYTNQTTCQLPPLEEVCRHCNGEPLTPNPAWQEWNRVDVLLLDHATAARREAGITEANPLHQWMSEIPDPCEARLGLAHPASIATLAWREHQDDKPEQPEMDWCGECEGTGLQLTASGRQILDLVRRHTH